MNTTPLAQHEQQPRDVANDGARFWTHDLDDPMHDPHRVFGADTVGVVDELAGGIVLYTHSDHAAAIIDALRAQLGEV